MNQHFTDNKYLHVCKTLPSRPLYPCKSAAHDTKQFDACPYILQNQKDGSRCQSQLPRKRSRRTAESTSTSPRAPRRQLLNSKSKKLLPLFPSKQGMRHSPPSSQQPPPPPPSMEGKCWRCHGDGLTEIWGAEPKRGWSCAGGGWRSGMSPTRARGPGCSRG